jgi:hypothetical protein
MAAASPAEAGPASSRGIDSPSESDEATRRLVIEDVAGAELEAEAENGTAAAAAAADEVADEDDVGRVACEHI